MESLPTLLSEGYWSFSYHVYLSVFFELSITMPSNKNMLGNDQLLYIISY